MKDLFIARNSQSLLVINLQRILAFVYDTETLLPFKITKSISYQQILFLFPYEQMCSKEEEKIFMNISHLPRNKWKCYSTNFLSIICRKKKSFCCQFSNSLYYWFFFCPPTFSIYFLNAKFLPYDGKEWFSLWREKRDIWRAGYHSNHDLLIASIWHNTFTSLHCVDPLISTGR